MKNSIGFVSGLDGFYNSKKIKQVTDITKKFFSNWSDETYKNLLEKFNLDENKFIKNLSAGMKVKYQLAIAMSHDARLLILDEPMNGLDKRGVIDMRNFFEGLKKEGKTILMASHSKEDIDVLCDEVYEMDMGKLSKVR